jgi:hypothetical protein
MLRSGVLFLLRSCSQAQASIEGTTGMDQESLNQIRQIVMEATEVVEGRLRGDIGAVEGRLRGDIEAVEGRLRGDIEEVKRHTGVLVEHLEQKIELLAEGHESLHHKIEDVRSELQSSINHESHETRALLRSSYQHLHQRVE